MGQARQEPGLNSSSKIREEGVDVGAGGYVGKAEHFPAFSMEARKAQPFGEADCPHIHGHEAWER